jgi:hypothetical protein
LWRGAVGYGAPVPQALGRRRTMGRHIDRLVSGKACICGAALEMLSLA